MAYGPFEEEINQNADNRVEFLKFTLEIYGKGVEDVVALIGDNCNSNKAVATNLRCQFIGCSSHRLNLAVKAIIADEQYIIDRVHEVMEKLRYPIAAAKLRKLTYLTSQLNNDTRWSSTYAMLDRYKKLREFLPDIGIPEVVKMAEDMSAT